MEYKCLKNIYHYDILVAKKGEVVEIENDTLINKPRHVSLKGWNEKLGLFGPEEKILKSVRKSKKNDSVNHPSHYTSHPSGIECIEITRHYCFSIGNAIKYLWRAGLKSDAALSDKQKEIEDLEKAVWYINDRIKQLRDEV